MSTEALFPAAYAHEREHCMLPHGNPHAPLGANRPVGENLPAADALLSTPLKAQEANDRHARSRLAVRAHAFRHKAFVRLFSGIAPYYVVNEYPKSGGTWLAQMLAAAMALPFRRNEPVRLERSVTHGHFLGTFGLRNTVVLWRDPRDLIVSFYYHCYFIKEHGNSLLIELMKDRSRFSDYSDIRTNLPAFIHLISTHPVSPSFDWPDFARVWLKRPGTVQTTYEGLRANTPRELQRIVQALTGQPLDTARAHEVAAQFEFSRVKADADRKRTRTDEVSFVREGAVGGWKRHFSPEAEAALAEEGYFDAMRVLGYLDRSSPSQATSDD